MIIRNLLSKIFKSNEIIDYLLCTPDYLTEKKLSEIICRAPIDIRRKKDMLLSLWKSCEDKGVTKSQYKYNYDLVQYAIDNMQSDIGDIFSVQSCWRGDSDGDFRLCRNFEAALKAIETDMKNEGTVWETEDSNFWYEIRKWSPENDGSYSEKLCWFMINGKIMYFCLGDKYSRIDCNTANDFEPYEEINIITPFKTGDILTVDCRPFQPLTRVLILNNFADYDCCFPQALFIGENGSLAVGAVKHSHIFANGNLSGFSPLYNAVRLREPLAGEEKILEKVQSYIGTDSAKGEEIWRLVANGKNGREPYKICEMDEYLNDLK